MPASLATSFQERLFFDLCLNYRKILSKNKGNFLTPKASFSSEKAEDVEAILFLTVPC